MSNAIDLWLGPDIKERLERFIQGLVDEPRSFGAREFAEQYYLVSAPPVADLERCKDLDGLIRRCRQGPRSLALYAFQVQAVIGIGSILLSAVGPDERFHVVWIFDEEDSVKWPVQEVELEQIEQAFEGAVRFPDWPYLSSLLMDPARN
jgi:hypothetical protein